MTDTNPIRIDSATARPILDSRGWPTIEVTLTAGTADATASAPAGASTGEHEAVELRDGGELWSGRGVDHAVRMTQTEVGDLLTSRDWVTLPELDTALTTLDGTENLARIGANTAVAVSIAATRLFAHSAQLPLHAWIAQQSGARPVIPVPHFNVLNGGAHAANDLAFQEFMIAPVGAADIAAAVESGAAVYHALAALIRHRYASTGLGDEGGFAPPLSDPREALDLLVEAIQQAGHRAALDDIAIALDPAANGFSTGPGRYTFSGRELDRETLVAYYRDLVATYPIRSIEDGFAEDDHEGWGLLFQALGDDLELVGDDLYVTDAARIADGARAGLSNAALIKPNQIGTVSRTLAAIATARSNGMQAMASHRSGETLDPFIADLAVGTGIGRIKSGAPARGERVAKYNRLTRLAAADPTLGFGLAPA
ncbi:phosphopyruvate hydratase [Amnibacterium sp.]|uniref:phosphopyruvate hydratase n=1 Tax=Amnibacterium sp. TaxID=1872496 RepID=UPI003F7CB5C7